MEKRLTIITEQFSAALQDFRKALELDLSQFDPGVVDVIKNGQVQKYEFTVELLWKMLKVFLYEQHGTDAASPKQTIRTYFELGFCEYQDAEQMLEAVDMRNRLIHVYKKEILEEIHSHIKNYKDLFDRVFQNKPW
jgi:nucleotidyltransferase substrate binding protein (TIGR01987 family)